MRKFDIFGSQIQFRFQGSKSYTTSLGFFFTVAIACVVILRFVILLNEVYTRVNPTVLQKERQVDSPEKFIMNNYTLPFAFGMQDGTTENHYIDPSIYKVAAYQVTKYTTYDESGQPQVQLRQSNAIVQRCSQDNFQNPNTKNNFLNLPYLNLYCIHPEFQEVMEGDYSQPEFQHFMIQVFPCSGQGCGDTTTLSKGFFAIYFQDVIVSPDIKDEPFKYYNRDLFWITSTSSPREITMYFRNNYIESDYGWVTSDIQTVRHASYSTQDVSFTSDVDYFVQLVLRFEKQKENVYQRKYKNLTNIISEIGGFTQSMLAIGFIVCSSFSDFMLSKSIIIDQFDFKTSKNKSNNNIINEKDDNTKIIQMSMNNFDQIKKYKNYNDNFKLKNKESQLDLKEREKNIININDKNKIKCDISTINLQKQESIQQLPKYQKDFNKQKSFVTLSSIIKKKSTILLGGENSTQNVTKSSISQKNQRKKTLKAQNSTDQNNNEINNEQFKKLLFSETNSMEFGFFDYIKYFIWPFGEIKRKKEIIDYSIQKLYYHLDVIQIVKKLLEIDKLKQLIMDKDQIQLFEYISKPVIYEEEVIKNQSQSDQINQQQEKYSILYQDKRSEMQKVQDAYQSYQNIINRNNQSVLDRKILNHLDPQLLNLFNYQQEEEVINQNRQIQNHQIDNASQQHNLNDYQKQMSENNFSLCQNQQSNINANQNVNPLFEEQSNFFDHFNLEELTHVEVVNRNIIGGNGEITLSKKQIKFQQ